MPKIAKMAQVAPPLIHYYFGSKDNLWRETVNYSLGGLRRETAAIRDATRALAPLDRLRAQLQAYTQFAARCPEQFVMIIAEARSDSDRFAWVKENFTTAFVEGVSENLADARESGLIKDIDIEQLSWMMLGGVLLYFTVNPTVTEGKDVDGVAGDYTKLMFDTFLEGIMPKDGEAG